MPNNPDVRRRSPYLWLGALGIALGAGAGIAGSGVASADADTSSPASTRNSESPRHSRAARSDPEQLQRVRDTTFAPAGPARAAVLREESVAPIEADVTIGASAPAPLTLTIPAATRAPAPMAPAAATYTVANPIPSRLQWNANNGYCGETSFVSAGLYYGQYISQYDARKLASRNAPQNLESSQLLLGVNDVAAATAMHLTATAFNTATQTDTPSFLKWVKSKVAAGYPVAIGVYTNESRFYGSTNPNAGDPEYDHIVTVTGISSSRPFTGPTAYYADDIITFSDNGLWTGTPTGLPQYVFSYGFGAFPATRRKANAALGPVYSLSNGKNYGIAITGVADRNRETVPVRLTTSVNAENPAMVEGSTSRPAAKPVTLTATVSKLTPGTTYNLYRYNSMAAVPDGAFNATAAKAAQKWTFTATGTTYTMSQTIMSNEIAAYRAVPVTAG